MVAGASIPNRDELLNELAVLEDKDADVDDVDRAIRALSDPGVGFRALAGDDASDVQRQAMENRVLDALARHPDRVEAIVRQKMQQPGEFGSDNQADERHVHVVVF